jgi:hypothetical protein
MAEQKTKKVKVRILLDCLFDRTDSDKNRVILKFSKDQILTVNNKITGDCEGDQIKGSFLKVLINNKQAEVFNG